MEAECVLGHLFFFYIPPVALMDLSLCLIVEAFSMKDSRIGCVSSLSSVAFWIWIIVSVLFFNAVIGWNLSGSCVIPVLMFLFSILWKFIVGSNAFYPRIWMTQCSRHTPDMWLISQSCLRKTVLYNQSKKKKTPKKNDRVVVSSQRESFVNTVGCFSAWFALKLH